MRQFACCGGVAGGPPPGRGASPAGEGACGGLARPGGADGCRPARHGRSGPGRVRRRDDDSKRVAAVGVACGVRLGDGAGYVGAGGIAALPLEGDQGPGAAPAAGGRCQHLPGPSRARDCRSDRVRRRDHRADEADRLFCSSAISRSPEGVTAMPFGALSRAALAGPPSPESPRIPSPASVVITPSGSTRRTRLLELSAIRKAPFPSSTTLCGSRSAVQRSPGHRHR